MAKKRKPKPPRKAGKKHADRLAPEKRRSAVGKKKKPKKKSGKRHAEGPGLGKVGEPIGQETEYFERPGYEGTKTPRGRVPGPA